MAAADTFEEPLLESEVRVPRTEEHLEVLARDIDNRTVFLQARMRGYLARDRLFSGKHGVCKGDDADGFPTSAGGGLEEGNEGDVFTGEEYESNGVASSEVDSEAEGAEAKGDQVSGDDGGRYDRDRYEATNDEVDNDEVNSAAINSSQDDDVEDLSGLLAKTTPEERDLEAAANSWVTSLNHIAPWWIKNTLPQDKERLCAICSHIDFDTLLHKTDAYMYEPAIPLGTFQSIARKTSCSFCRLVAHMGSILLHDNIDSIRNTAGNISCELCGDPDWDRYATRIRNLCLKLTIRSPNGDEEVAGTGWIQQILTRGEKPPEQRWNDSRLVKDQIDMELIKSWLRTCKEDHNSTMLQSNMFHGSFAPETPTDMHDTSALIMQPCRPTPLSPTDLDLTVINVEKECLVDVPSDTAYVALSYVWGGPLPFQNVKERNEELYEPHSISSDNKEIPRTIRDAIRLVALVEEKYIWVDSLCICQDDVENKMAQIENMGNIYSRAIFTIVAACGKGADSGLPGVQPLSRKTIQRAELVQGMILANELPFLHDTIGPSYWNTRGWTYQENELSKRYLLLCETHVYFRCNRAVFKEDSGLRNHAYLGGRALRIRGERHPIWNNYRRAVEGFTKRTLSFEADMVNAFQGIASLLQPAFKGDFLFGLPETELDIALLWQPDSLIHRRVDPGTGAPLFPSWSWAGWVGEVKYKWTQHLVDDLCRVKWQCTSPQSGKTYFLTSEELRAPRNGDHGPWEYVGGTRGPPYYYQRSNPDIWCLHPVAPKNQRKSRTLIQPGSQALTFKAFTAFFRISNIYRLFKHDLIASCKEGTHILCPLDIYNADGFVAGTIYIPGHAVSTTLENIEPWEFVCLSRRRGRYDIWTFDDVYKPFPSYDTYPSQKDDFKNISDRVTLYPNQDDLERAEDKYDHSRYNKNKPWPLYNVMMIERRGGGIAYRVAIGIVHVTAFMQARPTEKLVVLG